MHRCYLARLTGDAINAILVAAQVLWLRFAVRSYRVCSDQPLPSLVRALGSVSAPDHDFFRADYLQVSTEKQK